MISNVDFIITFLCILLCILSFSLGYYFACTRAENRFYNNIAKAVRNREREIKSIKAIKMDENNIPPDFIKMLEEITKEQDKKEK